MISISQIRAARALLDWTQNELAKKSGLSLRALNSIERGLAAPRTDTLRFIQETFEKENIEFTENDGVRRKTERMDILKYEGADCLGQHLLDIMQELRTSNGEVLLNTSSDEDFAGIAPSILDDYFMHLSRYRITERMLVAKGETYVIGPPSTYRWMRADVFSHVAYVVYGDNVSFQIPQTPHRVIIIRNPGIADMFRRQFEVNWALAEIPWFAKQYKTPDPAAPWSSAKAAAARQWIENQKL